VAYVNTSKKKNLKRQQTKLNSNEILFGRLKKLKEGS
jgi:hypothetical protein